MARGGGRRPPAKEKQAEELLKKREWLRQVTGLRIGGGWLPAKDGGGRWDSRQWYLKSQKKKIIGKKVKRRK